MADLQYLCDPIACFNRAMQVESLGFHHLIEKGEIVTVHCERNGGLSLSANLYVL